MDTSDIIALGALAVAILSIIATIVLAFYSSAQGRKLNHINLRASYYGRIFDDYLIVRIPKARNYIQFDAEGKLKDANELCDCMTDLRNSALFFQYYDEKFYKQIRKHTMDLEDFLANQSGMKHEGEAVNETLEEIRKRIKELYECILQAQEENSVKRSSQIGGKQ